MKNRLADPYQVFFPLGILAGLWGVGMWIVFALKGMAYPGEIHAELMIGGFLFLVAMGFLMTAIPRFTGTLSSTSLERGAALTVAILIILSSFIPNRIFFHVSLLLEMTLLAYFGGRRLKLRTFDPPPSFSLVMLGLGSGFSGTLILLATHFSPMPPATITLARLLLFYGTTHGLILGIGSQLIPRIMGTYSPGPCTTPLPTPMNAASSQRRGLLYKLIGIALLVSFFLEAFLSKQVGQILRSLTVCVSVFGLWSLHRKPKASGILSGCLWMSSWCFVLGNVGGALFPSYAVHGAHVLFIGAVSLMIFSIATRVVLSHGGYGLEQEIHSKALSGMLFLMMLAMILRLAAPFKNYFTLLALAALCFCAAAVLWSVSFMPKIFKTQH